MEPPPHNGKTGASVTNDGKDFIFKGSQVWNEKYDQVGRESGSLDGDELSDMDPFTGINDKQEFQNATQWDKNLNLAIDSYFQQLQDGLVYSFRENPNRKFIRKLYMSAGTDAHGDFNYTDSVLSTSLDTVDNTVIQKAIVSLFTETDTASLHSNAYGRVRTYTLTSERPDQISSGHLNASVNAYRDGNTILTDGPICTMAVDSDCRHNSNPTPPLGPDVAANPNNPDIPFPSWIRWHDATCNWQNGDGQIGGYGTFDGGKTALVPVSGKNLLLRSMWKGRPDLAGNSPYGMTLDFNLLRSRGIDTGTLLGEARDVYHSRPLPKQTKISGLNPHALVMRGSLNGPSLRPDVDLDERCITNPIWMVPVEINVKTTDCPIKRGALTLTFNFGISMNPTLPTPCNDCVFDPAFSRGLYTGAKAYIQPLDSLGNSVDPVVQLWPSPGWGTLFTGEGTIDSGKFTVTNGSEIACPKQSWDAKNHSPGIGLGLGKAKSYVVYVTNLRDIHGNSLNDVGRTISATGLAPGYMLNQK